MQVVRPPFLSRIPDLSPPPTIGQHTREVVASLPPAGG
jgi:hypothetical protein